MTYHAAYKVTDDDIFDNRLILGDNLLALKALESEFTGKVQCIYIDPPYNKGGPSGITTMDSSIRYGSASCETESR
jgi:adenine-specific DNA-methyltransferase